MRRLLAPRTPLASVAAWPLRVMPAVLVASTLLGVALVIEPDSEWNGLVVFVVVSVCVLVLAFGLFVGVVAWLVLRRQRDAPETAGSVTGLVSGVPLLGAGFASGSGDGLLGWAVAAVVVALVVGLVTARDARRVAAAADPGAGSAQEGDLGREGSSSGR